MKLSFHGERVLAVMAHPDDAELVCAGTLARARDDGAGIAICVMCRGDKGVASSHAGDASALASIRHTEAKAGADLLKAELLWFDCGDGELFDTRENRAKLVEIYRQFRPTLVITHAPQDYHPDHRAASTLAEAATWFCASRGHVTPSEPLESPPALWFADTLNMSGFDPGFYIDVSERVALKGFMLMCHKSQLQRQDDSDFTPLMELMHRQMQVRGSQANVAAAEAFRQHHAFRRASAW